MAEESISKSLLDAISIIAQKTADDISSDKTIIAIIKKSINTSEGKYLITYNSGNFYAYLQSGSKEVYSIGDQVYILVPQGDMSQRKFIIGKVQEDQEDQSSTQTSVTGLLNDYNILGSNAVVEKSYKSSNDLYVTKMQPLALNSHDMTYFYYCYVRETLSVDGIDLDYDSNIYPIIDIDEESFSNSAKQAEALLIRAKFKASLTDIDNIGNYGIIVNIAFEDTTNPQVDDNNNVTYPPKLIAYVLDMSKMTGNPIKYYDYTWQYMISNFDGEHYLYIDSIIAFSEGFVNNNTVVNDVTVDPKIYIDNLEILALDEITSINGDYKLQLSTPQGNTIKENENKDIVIKAKVTYLNQDITDNCAFYWGAKDPSVINTHEDYNGKLGSGYRYIDFAQKNVLTLSPNQLTMAENTYVCLAIYESNIILKTTTSIFNNNNKIEVTIESDQGTNFQFNEGNPTLTCLINGKRNNYSSRYSDSLFNFIWSKVDTESGGILFNKTVEELTADKEKELAECGESGVSSEGRSIMQVLSYYLSNGIKWTAIKG